MADPLSIASGVAGLVSLGLTLCGGLHNYFSTVKGRHQDIETASRSLTLLQSNLFIIQSSTLKLGHRHALSANGVNQGLTNCEFELVALQQLMLNLTRDEGLSDMKGKMRKQMMIARYPFDQKKLVQIQDQLSKANATLSSFVQNFNLDINIGISEDLRILRSYTNANDSITHNMLGKIARRLEAISPVVQRTEIQLAKLSQHVQDNCLDTSGPVSDVVVQPRYLQNYQKEETMMAKLNDTECTCSDPSTRSICRKSSYVNRSWGVLIVSKQEHIRQRHQPSCIFFSHSLQTSKTTFHYLGLRYQLSRILSMSLTREYPPGAYSLSFGIQPCNIVERSPAFQALRDLERKYDKNMELHNRFNLREETSALIKNLRTIYESTAASPFDVDRFGDNIAHISMSFYRTQLIPSLPREGMTSEDILASIRSLLSYMFDIGVPVSASNFYQETILHNLWHPDSLMMLFQLYNFIATLDTSFTDKEIGKPRRAFLGPNVLSSNDLFQVWGKYPEIAEAFGFNDIFRVVMQKNRQKLEAMTVGDQFWEAIMERDIYDRNILHASITWPEGLSLLLQHSQTVCQLCDKDSITISPLELAVRSSGEICTQSDKWVMCQNCQCAASVQLLLEADCRLPTHLMEQRSLEKCSLKCRRLLFKHFKNRRQRLRDLSLAMLPPGVIHRYGVTADFLPDATAKFLWEELESRCGESTRQGFETGHGLKPFHSLYSSRGGLFEEPLSPQICLLADEFGIKPSDEDGLEPLLARVYLSAHSYDSLKMNIVYLNWLLQHDFLKMEYEIGGFPTSALHEFGGRIGRYGAGHFPYQNGDPLYWAGEGISLIAKICNSEMQSDLPCPCISGAFNRPLASLFSGFTAGTLFQVSGKLEVISSIRDLVGLIEKITNTDPSYLTRCAIHAITMECLGIRHIGHCPWDYSILRMERLTDEDEWAELLDEDRHLLEKLDDLDAEFETKFQSRNQSVSDFLGGYYTERMTEVMQEMDGSPADDYRCRLQAAGVVLVE